MNTRQYINLLILLVQEILEFPHFGFQGSNSLFQRLGVAPREGPPAEFITRLALEAHVGALRAAGRHPITADLLTPTSIAGLSNPTLGTRPYLDDLHWKDTGHDSGF